MPKKRKRLRPCCSEIGTFHDGEVGRCPKCGRKIVLPCLACRLEAVAEKSPESTENLKDDSDFLAIKLKTKSQRKRYLKIRNYRDRFEKSMLLDDDFEKNDNSSGSE